MTWNWALSALGMSQTMAAIRKPAETPRNTISSQP
jgi:hypothetical protein